MPEMTRVSFARINRRNQDQPPLNPRTFREDMEILGQSGHMEARRGDKTYIAGDLEVVEDGNFMIGVLGYQVVEEVRRFQSTDRSWIKGDTTTTEGALRDTTVPFAVDLGPHRRWVAFAPSGRIRSTSFANSFREVLNAAIRELDLWPTDWEVDLVTSTSTIRAWVEQHPRINKLARVVRMTNPGLNLDEERARMRALGAQTKREEFTAGYNGLLRIQDNEAFEEAIEGVAEGDVDIRLYARGDGTKPIFNSRKSHDETLIPDFGGDLVYGMELVLAAVREYSEARASDA